MGCDKETRDRLVRRYIQSLSKTLWKNMVFYPSNEGGIPMPYYVYLAGVNITRSNWAFIGRLVCWWILSSSGVVEMCVENFSEYYCRRGEVTTWRRDAMTLSI